MTYCTRAEIELLLHVLLDKFCMLEFHQMWEMQCFTVFPFWGEVFV